MGQRRVFAGMADGWQQQWKEIAGGVRGKRKGGGPGAVVKTVCFETRRSRVQAPLWHSGFKETEKFFPAYT